MKHFFKRIKNLFIKNKKGNFPESDIFNGENFIFPFESPAGIVHEIYQISPCGICGFLSNDKNEEKTTGTLYSIRAEIEKPKNTVNIIDICEYMKENPHVETERKILDVWMTDESLINHLKNGKI
jgi:hypothetical protein